jgi:hypothetical protein
MDVYNDDAMKSYNDKALDACPHCGRTFLPDRLIIHLKSCGKGKEPSGKSVEPTRSSFKG